MVPRPLYLYVLIVDIPALELAEYSSGSIYRLIPNFVMREIHDFFISVFYEIDIVLSTNSVA
jgi:hypothetical protein